MRKKYAQKVIRKSDPVFINGFNIEAWIHLNKVKIEYFYKDIKRFEINKITEIEALTYNSLINLAKLYAPTIQELRNKIIDDICI